jgi:hypothetical protein
MPALRAVTPDWFPPRTVLGLGDDTQLVGSEGGIG